MHIGYVPRERPPFSALNIRSGAYHFHELPKNPFRSITILHFLADYFCRSGDHQFQNVFNFNPFIASHGRLSPVRQRRGLAAVPDIRIFRIFTLKTDQARSGAPHFHAQNGSSSFRNPAFSSSKRLKLVREPHIFTLDRELVPEPCQFFTLPRHIPTKIWGEYPPPPPGGNILPQ